LSSKNHREKFWSRAHKAEYQYAASLRKIAKHIEDIVKQYPIDSPFYAVHVERAMRVYAKILEPWAQAAAQRMLADVSRRNLKAWESHSEALGRGMQKEIEHAPTGQTFQMLMGEQVKLITSLPLDAAQRVHEIVTGGLYESSRGEDIIREILKSGHVTRSRATLIARTETARATSLFTQARAQYVGSDEYIWRTADDEIVRKAHREMEGVVVKWSQPPRLSDGTRTHAGCIYNCRCYPEPIIPQSFSMRRAA
jgi:SPP1 gp7 family putative phage head morphogenesis protein